MRLYASNLLTSAATLVVLAVLTIPATRVFLDAREASATGLLPARSFGVYVDPWHVDGWARAVGAAPQIAAKFESFSRGSTLDGFLGESERQGIRQVIVSWEPWRPVPAKYGALQSLPQRGYRNADIARGEQDDYIERFARSLASFPGIVWLRYAHEMNGFWYPWTRGHRRYVKAWRHLVALVRGEGASNVRFVWSPNPSLFESRRVWMRGLRAYWPGSRWVDAVGSTMINFGGAKRYPVSRFVPRLRALRGTFHKPVMITEASTDSHGRVRWLRDLRRMLRDRPWIRALAWSQLPSRGDAQMRRTGDLSWDVRRDPRAAAVLRGIARDFATASEVRRHAVSRLPTAYPTRL